MLITTVVSWPVGILQAISSGSAQAILSVTNGLFFPLLVAELLVWAALLSNRRRRIGRSLTVSGMEFAGRPAILTPSRFARWCDAESLPLPEVRSALSDAFS